MHAPNQQVLYLFRENKLLCIDVEPPWGGGSSKLLTVSLELAYHNLHKIRDKTCPLWAWSPNPFRTDCSHTMSLSSFDLASPTPRQKVPSH